MKNRWFDLFIIKFGILVLLVAPNSVLAIDENGLLSPGDVISINVYEEEEFNIKSVKLTDVGTITFPFIGDVMAVGKTKEQLKESITEKLLDGYLRKPKVTVTIVQYRPFFVFGQVTRPGSYPYEPGLTVRKAITIAGGLTDRASTRKIKLIKEGTDDAESVIDELDLIEVGPGDVVTIGESLF